MATRTLSREWTLTGPRLIELSWRELRELPPTHARLRFLYCGICGSDVSKFEARRPIDYPMSIGHEFIAEVVDVGAAATGFQPGDIVTSDLNYRCLSCEQCRAGRSHLCTKVDPGGFTNRALADYGDVDTGYLIHVPVLPGAHLALAEPLSCVLHAKDWISPRSADRVLVIGAGGLGICMAYTLVHDASPGCFDIVEQIASRAKRVGAAIGSSGRVVGEAEGPYDIVVDLSGTASGLAKAASLVRRGGRLCSMSHLDSQHADEFLLPALTRTDVEFKVSYLNGERRNLQRAVRLLAKCWSHRWDETLGVVPFDAVADAFAARSCAPECKTIVDITRDRSI
jgi:threonine dehydrogenase-like Zn-dependent dehydrogenase